MAKRKRGTSRPRRARATARKTTPPRVTRRKQTTPISRKVARRPVAVRRARPARVAIAEAREAAAQGVDVSHHQGAVDWAAVKKSGIRFAVIKATEGETLVDSRFQKNWLALEKAGLTRGAYHFFRPKGDPAKQADLFVTTLGVLRPDDLAPVIDVEVADGVAPAAVLDGVAVWLERVGTATGRTPIVYTGVSFWKNTLGNSTRFADHPLWIAHYTSASHPTVPGGWSTWTLWQFSDKGKVPGIKGPVDLDRRQGANGPAPRRRESQ